MIVRRQVFKTKCLHCNILNLLIYFTHFISVHLAVFILEEDKMVDETFRDVIQDELRLTYKFYVQVSVLSTSEAILEILRYLIFSL